jgi:hypothetical protein
MTEAIVIDGARWGQRQHRREVVRQALKEVRRGAPRLDLRIEWTIELAPAERLARQAQIQADVAAALARQGVGAMPTVNRLED